ncbi:MAG TPA: indolepyruvate ferredoxin oxidoreductase subunit alpha [Bacteroidales bacterium]|nr:indolepyruvate ferredoxin oxidoreductase subunit alpha [Bacteroidales bacterium]
MDKILLLADEAIAQAAIDAGLSGVYAYPGTPSTEITEYIQASEEGKSGKIRSQWAANEKTAYEAALGMSYAGKRALVCMKHVGLNVAADGFINSAITGTNGGLVIVVADDPSMHSSQNEQDSRFYGKFAMIPMFEPADQQEAYDIVYQAFDLSEYFKLPVMVRIVTRLAHSRAGIVRRAAKAQKNTQIPDDSKRFVLLPAIARQRYKSLLGQQKEMMEIAYNSPFNKFTNHSNKSIGIIACGITYNYLLENFPDGNIPYPVLKLSHYPISQQLISQVYDECETVLVLEDGYPFVEEQLRGIMGVGTRIHGRMNGILPRDGELTPDIVGAALGLKQNIKVTEIPEVVTNRPPSFCKGCAHIDIYTALNEALKDYTPGRVFADIGCYTLGALPPFNAINSCVDMGASITMAKGAYEAGLQPAVAVIGDSTFTHSGMTGLLDAVNDNVGITVIIADNATTGMTGGQKSSATGRIEQICEGLGVEKEHIVVFNPLKKNHEEAVALLKKELEYKGVSVIIGRRECIQTLSRKHRN